MMDDMQDLQQNNQHSYQAMECDMMAMPQAPVAQCAMMGAAASQNNAEDEEIMARLEALMNDDVPRQQPVQAQSAVIQQPAAVQQQAAVQKSADWGDASSSSEEEQELRGGSSSECDVDMGALGGNNSAEECDSDDLEGDLNLSDEEDSSKRGFIKQQKKMEREQRGKKEATKFQMECDTNVFEVKYSCLQKEAAVASGDPEFCSKCQAVFNYKSKIVVENGQ